MCDITPSTNEEIEIILQYIKRRDYQFYVMLNMLLYTGIRGGELSALKMKDLLGHANSKMLIDTYAHANLGIKQDSVNKITESYGIIDT